MGGLRGSTEVGVDNTIDQMENPTRTTTLVIPRPALPMAADQHSEEQLK